MKVTDADRASVALFHLDRLRNHLSSGPITEPLVFDAACMRLAAAVDSASKISEATRARLFGDAWPAMWSTRNHIAHGYIAINLDVIVATLKGDLDAFEAALRSLTGGSVR